ncbi:MAG: DUF3291 domain-containing protein [Pseudomonadota bacterium]
MSYSLAQANIARFIRPSEDPANKDFVDNLDRVNAIAEEQPGFIWRMTGDGNDALDIRPFEDPQMAINMSVWRDIESLAAFVYRNDAHREIMRRRKEWFEKMEFYMVLWWIDQGHTPDVEEAKEKLASLQQLGPTAQAFTFKTPFASPTGELAKPILDECA